MNKCFALTFLTALAASQSAYAPRAAVLTLVPMQGTMVMPMIRYDAASARLRVTLDPTVPQLTPLMISHPSDSFDPSDPWHDSLDPSKQGSAFSRRYGFVMDTMTDPLPAGSAILLRCASKSPDLGFYQYRSSIPKAWKPIFGTEGTTNSFRWDGMMFHPGVTAPPGTQSFTAAFEAVLVQSENGAELPNSGTGLFELNWTNMPDGRPALEVAMRIVVSHSSSADWILETTDSLTQSNWQTVTNAPVVWEEKSAVLLAPEAAASQFFRMRRAQ